ncbi:hypothetical protein AcV7_002336 [Taiwanofungus camphoratus]|nr:hypothetical protein AcV7_002336 [Antrodia cinnamomea]
MTHGPPFARRSIAVCQEVRHTNISHLRFLAEASTKAEWKDTNAANGGGIGKGRTEGTESDFDTPPEGKAYAQANSP